MIREINLVFREIHNNKNLIFERELLIKNAKQPSFFYSQPSTLPKEELAKFYLSATLL